MSEVSKAIDACLERAERQFDARIRELGGTPVPSAAQIARLAEQWAAAGRVMRTAFAEFASNLGGQLVAWGKALAPEDDR